jgi:hypothetical protein
MRAKKKKQQQRGAPIQAKGAKRVGKVQTINIDDDEEEEEEDYENEARAPNTRADVDAGIGAKIKGNQNKKGAKVQPFGE